MAMRPSCPCGSGAPYPECCEPYHLGAEPPDPERLVRARFAAFARGEYPFLHRTLHRDHEDRAASEADFVKRLREHGRRARYRALEIFDRDGPDADGVWRVLFRVDAANAGRDASFVELSSFVASGEGLRYVGGRGFRPGALPRTDGLTIAEIDALGR